MTIHRTYLYRQIISLRVARVVWNHGMFKAMWVGMVSASALYATTLLEWEWCQHSALYATTLLFCKCPKCFTALHTLPQPFLLESFIVHQHFYTHKVKERLGQGSPVCLVEIKLELKTSWSKNSSSQALLQNNYLPGYTQDPNKPSCGHVTLKDGIPKCQ